MPISASPDEILTRDELVEYIKNRTYRCPFCVELQKRVAADGLDAIGNWDGMICGSIEDMQIRLHETETGIKWVPVNIDDLFE